MKLQELSFTDLAAIELLPALIRMERFFGNDPEQKMARVAYLHADALSAVRDKRNEVRDHTLETLRIRVERAEKSVEVFRTAPLAEALEKLLNHYLSLANSGDAGNWDPEKEAEVIEARAALAGAK